MRAPRSWALRAVGTVLALQLALPVCSRAQCVDAADCDDDEPCTIDACDPDLDCINLPVPDGTPCEDGDACTVGDACLDGSCESGGDAATIDRPRLTLGHLHASGETRLRFRGSFVPPRPLGLDPVANGIRLLVFDVDGTLLADLLVPGGAFDPVERVGWSSSGSKVTYVDRRRLQQGPVSGVVLRNRSASTPGLVLFKVKGKRGSFTIDADSLPLSVALDLDPRPGFDAAGCAEYNDGPTLACSISPAGATVKCK